MIYMTIRYEEILEAREYEKEVNKIKETKSQVMNSIPDHRSIGRLGELLVRRYFNTCGIEYKEPEEEYSPDAGDSCDFIVKGRKIDVKTSKKFKQICLNKGQYWKAYYKKIDYFIGVWISEDLKSATIFGWGYWKDMVRDSQKDFMTSAGRKEMYSLPFEKHNKFKIDDVII